MQVVTFLAMEIVLHLVSAALIGTGLGWVIWGRSNQRQIARIHSGMTTAIEAERSLADEARRDLENADAKLNQLLEDEKANSAKAMIEVRQFLETEKQETHAARADLGQLRLDMDDVINAEKTSTFNAMQEDMKAASRAAEDRETQIRAELEELRLMAGAEKLAAQSARAELDQVKMAMRSSLEAERETSVQARSALDDIRATLARTFGEKAGIVAALDSQTGRPPAEAMSRSIIAEMPASQQLDNDPAHEIEGFDGIVKPTVVSNPMTAPGIDIEPDVAFDVRDEAIPSSDEPSQNNILIDPADTSLHPEDPAIGEDQQHADQTIEPVKPALHLPLPTVNEEQPEQLDEVPRPPSFYDERPDDVDMLQAIGGIDPALEEFLNDSGCYQFKQIARFSTEDIDWLTWTAAGVPDLRERIGRDGWIEQAKELQKEKYMTSDTERPRWWNRQRLQ